MRYCKFYSECKKKAEFVIPYSNLGLCSDHFVGNVEKRVKELIDKKHMIKPFHPEYYKIHEKILVPIRSNDYSSLLFLLLQKIFPDVIIESHNFTAESKDEEIFLFAEEHQYNAIATAECLTDEMGKVIENFLEQDLDELSSINYLREVKGIRHIKPLYYISEEELNKYAEFLGIEKPSRTYQKLEDIQEFINGIEDFRKSTIISLMRKFHKYLKPLLHE